MVVFTDRRAVKRGMDHCIDLDARIVGVLINADPGMTSLLEEWLDVDEQRNGWRLLRC